jgi:hypothetical protein
MSQELINLHEIAAVLVGGITRSGKSVVSPAAFSAAHGDPSGWCPADFETYENLAAVAALEDER